MTNMTAANIIAGRKQAAIERQLIELSDSLAELALRPLTRAVADDMGELILKIGGLVERV